MAGFSFVGLPGALAQLRPVAIREATIFTGNGGTIEGATLVVQGGKIKEVGKNADVPLLARKVSGKGKFITPGLIDVWTTLGARLDNVGSDATADARDVFDRYATDEIQAALRQGVTTVFVPARPRDGIGGMGAAFKLTPGVSVSEMHLEAAPVLSAVLGSDPNDKPLARVRAAALLRRAFQEAKEYREAWDDYAAELEEYEKKLKERAAGGGDSKPEAKKEDGGEDGGGGAAKSSAADNAGGGVATDSQGPVAEEADRLPTGQGGDLSQTSDDHGDTQPRPRRRRPPSPEDLRRLEELRKMAPEGGGKKEEKKDDLKKPAEPPKDRKKEALLKVLDGDVALRVEAHRPEDILNVLKVGRDFNIRLIIEGGSGAHLVPEQLAAAEVPVILGAPTGGMQFTAGPRQLESMQVAKILHDKRVKVYFGSGNDDHTRHLALNAARWAGYGLDSDVVLEAITSKAAALLGLEKQMGRLADGMPADFVVWSDHPFAPGAKVEQVYIDGKEVYSAEGNGDGGD